MTPGAAYSRALQVARDGPEAIEGQRAVSSGWVLECSNRPAGAFASNEAEDFAVFGKQFEDSLGRAGSEEPRDVNAVVGVAG